MNGNITEIEGRFVVPRHDNKNASVENGEGSYG